VIPPIRFHSPVRSAPVAASRTRLSITRGRRSPEGLKRWCPRLWST